MTSKAQLIHQRMNKYIPVTGYAVNKDVASKAQSEKTRTVTFIASTPSIDRDGDVTNSKGWHLDNFIKNPVIGYQHQVVSHGLCIAPDPDDIIGVGKNLRLGEKGELLVDITFEDKETNPKAEKIFRKVLNGTLSAVSVGFIPVSNENGEYSRKGIEEKGENPDANYLFGQELLEISIVNVPANPDAVALRKGLRSQTAGALVNLSKMLDKSFSELENMSIGEVVKALEGKEVNVDKNLTEEINKAIEAKMAEFKGTESNSDEAPNDGVALSVIEAELLIKQKQIK